MRADIESEIRKQQSARRFAEAADTFSNIVYEQPDSLEPAATRFGLKVQMVDAVRRVSTQVQEITTATREQSEGIGQVNEAIVQLDSVTQQNAALVEESAAAAQALRAGVTSLGRSVDVFRLG